MYWWADQQVHQETNNTNMRVALGTSASNQSQSERTERGSKMTESGQRGTERGPDWIESSDQRTTCRDIGVDMRLDAS